MFNTFTDSIIDTIQTAKKASADLIPHKELKQSLVNLVDVETKLTKEAVQAGSEFFTKLGEIAMDRTPFVEVQKNFEKFYPSNVFASSKKAK